MRCWVQGCRGAEKRTVLIFDLIFENFKGVGFIVLIFHFSLHTKDESKMDQKREPWAPLLLRNIARQDSQTGSVVDDAAGRIV